MSRRVAILGGRGYAGAEFLGLLAAHPQLELAAAFSSSQAGQGLDSVATGWRESGQTFHQLADSRVDRVQADAWLLALPNGLADQWVQRIEAGDPAAVIIDLSADYRFDQDWVYGLPELNRAAISSTRRIANPGCYATGAQLALAPLVDQLAETPVVFAVSGYSGAGRTPNERNDPERLRDNLLPYSLAGHLHEKEISHQLQTRVSFMPHVAAFFRGIGQTIHVRLNDPVTPAELLRLYQDNYAGEALLDISPEIPEVQQVAGTARVRIGGFTVDQRDPHSVVLVACLDNLLKGAASQAMQNMNLALGLDELTGIQ